MAETNKQFQFDNLTYDTYGEVTPSGDTLRYAITSGAKPGQLYKIEYLTKQGQPRNNSTLHTKQESGQLIPGFLTPISRTSDWGKTIDNVFYPEIMETPVTEDYSKVGKIKQLLYNFSRKYLEDGGKVQKGEEGLAFPKGKTTYMSPQGRQTIANKKLEGKQLPQGSIVKQTVNGLPGDLNNFGEQQTGQTGYSRIIKYGATPMQNDTVYTRTNSYGLGFENTPEGNKQGFNSIYYKKQGGKISNLLNNQEFLVNLEKCGGKMKKKACGGKMKKKK